MTKDEMLQQYTRSNYDIIQSHIKEAMQEGKRRIYVGKESFAEDFKQDWVCLDETKEKLEEDGFEIYAASYDEWEITW